MHSGLVTFGIYNMYVCLVDNSISAEITHRIQKKLEPIMSNKKLMTSKLINKYTKM